jgi:anti-sigma-K factor RskA
MAIDQEKFEELCSAYVLGALEGEDLREFQEAIRTADSAFLSIYRELQHAALYLPLTVEQFEPPPDAKTRIMSKIGAPQPAEGVIARIASGLGLNEPAVSFGLAVVLLLVVLGLSYYSILLRNSIVEKDNQISRLADEMNSDRQQMTVVREELAKKEELLRILQSPRIELAFMNGQEVAKSGYGKVIWDPASGRAILQISNLPAVPSGKDYQLWVIKDKTPISAGVFTVNDPETENFFKIDRLAEVDKKNIAAFAITLEPKGGVPQPTGEKYLVGTPSL